MPGATTYPGSFDPYLQYALDTPVAFRAFMDVGPDEVPWSLLVRLKNLTARQFRDALATRVRRGDEVQVGPTEDPIPYVTVRIPADLLLSMSAEWFKFWEETAVLCSLSLPADTLQRPATKNLRYAPHRPRSNAETIIGILDDGCPFAHAKLRTGLNSRVFAIWDQERGRKRITVSQSPLLVFGRKPADFRYGLEFWRAGGTSAARPPAREIGIDEWIAMHVTPAGTVDEDRCYAHGEFVSLRRRETHGSHVTDVLAGSVPTSARVSINGTTPPSFAADAQGASQDSDIVFVQIPRRGVEDASGQWLKNSMVDGLRYVLSCAGSNTNRVIFNVSYGQNTGPHDGMSAIEEYLALMTGFYDGTGGKPTLEVVLAAGNSRTSACHVAVRSLNERTEWTWRVPPDNAVPVMAEIRVRNADAAGVTFRALDPPAPYSGQQATVVPFTDATDTGWVLFVPPTRADAIAPGGAGPALHGDWKITVDCSRRGVELHAYVSRTTANIGAQPGARQSRFIDPAWELAHGAAAGQHIRAVPEATGSLVCSSGTLSGTATASVDRVYVAAGYCIATGRHSDYSSAGPSRGARGGPDYALPTDETVPLAGIPGAGTRSGVVFRLVGTSTAGPQLARLLAAGKALPPCPPGKQDPDIGCRILPPP